MKMNYQSIVRKIVFGLFLSLFVIQSYAAEAPIKIGWAEIDITPTNDLLPIDLRGQFHARITSTVHDPLTATALAIESDSGEQWILVSIDTLDLGPGGAREGWPLDHEGMLIPLRDSLDGQLSGFDLNNLTLAATHTHTAPYLNENIMYYYPTEEIVSNPYYDFVKEKLALVIQQAWNNRTYGGIGFEKGSAAVGFCRVVKYTDGHHELYGDTTRPDFDGLLTPYDHTLELMYTFNPTGGLTGIMINIVSPSQVLEGEEFISSDFWDDVRQELRETYGNDIYILPYGGAAGDMASRNLEEGTWVTTEEIGTMIADSVRDRYPFVLNKIKYQVEMRHIIRDVYLPTKSFYHTDHPVYSKSRPTYLVEIHAVRLDNTAWVNNPFELYSAWGKAIQNGSMATQTIIAQMSGLNRGGYLPTQEAVEGGAYGGQLADGWCDAAAGEELVENSVDMINSLFDVNTTPPIIALLGSTPVEVTQGSTYTDAGATATDNVDGDITANIVTVNPVDTNTVGTYTVTYNVSDTAGNAAVTVSRTVNVVDAVDKNLLLHWQFEESSGTTVSDSSENHLDGTLYNGPIWDSNAAIGNGALNFDGSDDYVSVDNAILDFGPNDFTVAIWVKKLEVSANWDNLWGVNKWNSGPDSSNNEWTLTLSNGDDDIPSFAIADATTIYQVNGSQDLTIGQWHHIVGVRSGSEIHLYVDGQLEGSTNVGTASINNAGRDLRIANSAVDAFQTHGTFDDLRIYNRALTESEIQSIMNGTTPPPPEDTVSPVITLIGSNPQTIEVGIAYTELGAMANDDVDGDISASIIIDDSHVNTSTVGHYSVTYNISDTAGNAAATVIRMVNVVDNAPNSAPVANAGPDQVISEAVATVTLDGSASSDADNNSLSYQWVLTVPSGSAAILSDANNAQTTFIPDVNGTYIAHLRVNDSMVDSVLDTVAILYSSTVEDLTRGGICLTFDDNYVESWHAARGLFDQYNAKVTFNLSWFHLLPAVDISRLLELKSDGHEIASHSLNHLDINGVHFDGEGGYGPASEVEHYIQEEIDPAIRLMAEAGLPPVTFAVPFNAVNDPYIDALLEKFSFVRGDAWVGDSNITTVESGYYTCSDHFDDRRYVHGFSGSESIENLNEAMEHAAVNDSVVLIYDHNILDAEGSYGIDRAKLEAILSKAHELGLKFYTRIELQKHQCD